MPPANGHLPDGLTTLGLGYTYEDQVHPVTIRFRHLGRSPEPHAEVDVQVDTGASVEHLCEAEPINLQGSGKKRDLAKKLEARFKAISFDAWMVVLDRGAGAVRQQMHRTVISPKRMVSLTPTYRSDRIADLVREETLNILYGEGGVGKGWIAVFGALCVQQGKPLCGLAAVKGDVLYLDWEDDELTFNNRVAIVAAGNGLEPEAPHYKRMIGPLSRQVEEVLEYKLEHQIAMVVIDSVSKAFPRGDFGSYESTADSMAETTALLGTTWAIDHVASANRSADALAGKPIGGIGKVNASRNMWEVTGHQDPDSCTVYTAIHQQKQNHTARLREQAFELDFDHPREPTRVHVRTRSIQDIPELAARTAVSERVYHALGQKRTYEGLYAIVGASDKRQRNTVQAAVARLEKKRLVVRGVSEGETVFWRPDARMLL
jgi:hypothetical protein